MAKNANGARRSTSAGGRTSVKEREAPVPKVSQQTGIVHIPPYRHGYCELTPARLREDTPFTVACYQHMGDRKTQEDRYLIVPEIRHNDVECSKSALFSVFDGTVGDFASENIKDIVLPTLTENANWNELVHSSQVDRSIEQKRDLLAKAVRETYVKSDKILLDLCSRAQQHYATCTGVTIVLHENLMAIVHLGDSRIALGIEKENGLVGEQATIDHKPDTDNERSRIEECGGMVERLVNHSNKPFIRGGDFMMRKALGEQPMQLQYSRAFGGKDLKIFGLSSEPDVKVIERKADVRWVILASDGLWDVCTAQQAVDIASKAHQDNTNPCGELVLHALRQMQEKKARADNITVVCVHFDL